MSPLPTVLSTARAPLARARVTASASVNANGFNMLEQRDGGGAERSHDRRAGRRHSDACHFGTQSREPLWHGPRLKPTFVAQVLGQVMMEPSAPRGAYPHSAQIACGAFLDAGV